MPEFVGNGEADEAIALDASSVKDDGRILEDDTATDSGSLAGKRVYLYTLFASNRFDINGELTPSSRHLLTGGAGHLSL